MAVYNVIYCFFSDVEKFWDSELVKSSVITKSNKIAAKMGKVNYITVRNSNDNVISKKFKKWICKKFQVFLSFFVFFFLINADMGKIRKS